jgi:hypothetical protein
MFRQEAASSTSSSTYTVESTDTAEAARLKLLDPAFPKEWRLTYVDIAKLEKAIKGDPPDDGDGDGSDEEEGEEEGEEFYQENKKPLDTWFDPEHPSTCKRIAIAAMAKFKTAYPLYWELAMSESQDDAGKHIPIGPVSKLLTNVNKYLQCPSWAYGNPRKEKGKRARDLDQTKFEVDEDDRFYFPLQTNVLPDALEKFLARIQQLLPLREGGGERMTLSEAAMKLRRVKNVNHANHLVGMLAYENFSVLDTLEARIEWAKFSVKAKRYLDIRTSLQWLIQPRQWRNSELVEYSPLTDAISQYDTFTKGGMLAYREFARVDLSNRLNAFGLSPLQIIAMIWEDSEMNRRFALHLIGQGADLNHKTKTTKSAVDYAITGGKMGMARLLASHGARPTYTEYLSDESKTAFALAKTEYTQYNMGRLRKTITVLKFATREGVPPSEYVQDANKDSMFSFPIRSERGVKRRSKNAGSSSKKLREQIAIRAYFRARSSGDHKNAQKLLAERIPSVYHEAIQDADKC